MTIYNIGSNYYLGNVKFGTFNVSYPSIPYLEAFPHNAISTEISALCTAAGLPFRNVLPQVDFDAYTANKTLLAFGSQGDIDDRYVFEYNTLTATVSENTKFAGRIYNNSGYTLTTNGLSATNALIGCKNKDTSLWNIGLDTTNIGSTVSSIQWAGCANTKELCLVMYQKGFGTDYTNFTFWYGGIMDVVPTDFNYYSADFISKSIILSGIHDTRNALRQGMNAKHYISSTGKDVLRTGVAEYPTEGSTTQWAKELGFFENNTTIGFPTMGQSNILKVLEGTYTIGKPANITGGNPNLKYIPLGLWTPNRQLALEVYSA